MPGKRQPWLDVSFQYHQTFTTPLVGRDRESQAINEAIDLTFSNGEGRVTVLTGEGGIGKTRLAKEAAQHALDKNANVLWGACQENGNLNPPYWLWVQALRSYLRTEGDHILALLPEMETHLPAIGRPPTVGSGLGSELGLYEYVSRFIKEIAAKKPVLLVLDDLQWADEHSLAMLETLDRLIETSRIMVLAVYRHTEVSKPDRLNQTLGTLSKKRAYRQITLDNWSQNDVGNYAMHFGSQPLTPDSLDSLYRRSGGNPLYVDKRRGPTNIH